MLLTHMLLYSLSILFTFYYHMQALVCLRPLLLLLLLNIIQFQAVVTVICVT
jgi:hypothetical protein